MGKKIWNSVIKTLISIKDRIVTEIQKSKIKIGPIGTKIVTISALFTIIAAICTTLDYLGIHLYTFTDKAKTTNDSSIADNNNSKRVPENQNDVSFTDNYLQPSQIAASPQNTDMDKDEKSDDDDVDNNDCNKYSVDIEENEKESPVSNVTNTISTPSDEIIKNHQEFIMQQKSKYTSSDIISIENTFVSLYVWEKAGEVSYVLEGTDQMVTDSIGGKYIPSATIIIIDYETDEVLYTLISDEDGYARYHPVDMRMFYCVVVTFDYQMFVSPPIHLIDNGYSKPNGVELFLDKPYSIYTQYFQIQIEVHDNSKNNRDYSFWLSHMAIIRCIDVKCEDYEAFKSTTYGFDTNSSGIISMGENPCYFSLSTQYIFNVSLAFAGMPHVIIDSSPKNTDIVEIYLEYTGLLS